MALRRFSAPVPTPSQPQSAPARPDRREYAIQVALREMGATDGQRQLRIEALPFGPGDATAGVENELQTAIVGGRDSVDLPRAIRGSAACAELEQLATRNPRDTRWRDLAHYLEHNNDQVWENSAVRLPYRSLNTLARQTLHTDLLANKQEPQKGMRADTHRHVFHDRGEMTVRIPVSYLHKLALADVLGADLTLPLAYREYVSGLLKHFTNDNTAPEQLSSYVVPLRRATGMGRAVARESAQRFLLTQLLTAYANCKFLLDRTGQHAVVYFAPHTPLRQKQLARAIPEDYYRDLFMNPCLSGWDRGEDKHRYMHLCHETLVASRRQAQARLRSNGISQRAGLSPGYDTSLANNGTHLSLGSRRLTGYFGSTPFGSAQEKVLGDQVIKISEYFLPLFVGTYSAAPWRIDVSEFNTDNILGFLPHQLQENNLRQFWRQWRKKARRLPAGAGWWDKARGRVLGLKGDYVPDMRLLDYFVALPGTNNAMLDGRAGNSARVIRDLEQQGVYSSAMTLYLPCRLREVARMGFSGFEGRYYSTFESLTTDPARSTELQLLITMLAYRYMADGTCLPAHIPDDRNTESERRQFFFAGAAGIGACYVRRQSLSPFLTRILSHAHQVRASHRYPGYLKVPLMEYRRALLRLLRRDGADLIELHGLHDTIADLERRLEMPDEHSAAGRMQRAILADLDAGHPINIRATEFNLATERYYREQLRVRHLREALAVLEEDAGAPDNETGATSGMMRHLFGDQDTRGFLCRAGAALIDDRLTLDDITRMIHLQLLAIRRDALASTSPGQEASL